MKRILITGMSGTGKTSVIGALTARGYKAVDTDDGYSARGPNGDWHWNEDALIQLLETEDADVLFVSGCVSNQGKFYPRFDLVILLSAPHKVMLERIGSRSNNLYGKTPEEQAEILANLEEVEPLLRRTSDHEIITDRPLERVVEKLLALVRAKL